MNDDRLVTLAEADLLRSICDLDDYDYDIEAKDMIRALRDEEK